MQSFASKTSEVRFTYTDTDTDTDMDSDTGTHTTQSAAGNLTRYPTINFAHSEAHSEEDMLQKYTRKHTYTYIYTHIYIYMYKYTHHECQFGCRLLRSVAGQKEIPVHFGREDGTPIEMNYI